MKKAKPQLEPKPYCKKHHVPVRTPDGYCWWGGEDVPASEWVYRTPRANARPYERQEGWAL